MELGQELEDKKDKRTEREGREGAVGEGSGSPARGTSLPQDSWLLPSSEPWQH